MHFVTGGAFNGKRRWVTRTYQLEDQGTVGWLSAYNGQSFPKDLKNRGSQWIVLEGIERWIKDLAGRYPTNECRRIWNDTLNEWLIWELEKKERTLILIGTDITKGIVPIKEEDRNWRDMTGWCYQDTASKAVQMDVIWYGINQRVK